MLHCLFHADDFGLTPAISQGILQALQQQRLQSISLMPGGVSATEAIAQLKTVPAHYHAVHLNVFEGKASSHPRNIPDLVTEEGFFYQSLGSLWRTLAIAGKRKKERLLTQLFDEFCAQIEWVGTNLGTTHFRLDGHVHVHALPALTPVIDALCQRYPICYIRSPYELRYAPPLPYRHRLAAIMRREILAAWSTRLQPILQKYNIAHADYFIGAYASGSMDLNILQAALQRINQKGVSGLVEIMLHPAIAQATKTHTEENNYFSSSAYAVAHNRPERANELHMLLSDALPQVLHNCSATFAPIA